MMRSIILVGYMCVGKTTLGKSLSKKLNRTFYDLDWYVEERFRKTVPQIFAERGEEGFRDLERRMLHEVAEFEDVVLSCGGGTPCFFDNMEYMNSCAQTVYLEASVDTILQHLSVSKGERPLLANKTPEELRAFIAQQIAEREPFYKKAQYVQDVDVLDGFDKIEVVTEQICELLHLK